MNRKLKARIIERFGHQVEFARAVGAREDTVSRVIYGRSSLSAEDQQKWAQVLNCPVKEIFSDE